MLKVPASYSKIQGATPGTFAYRHEQRHLWQDTKGLLDIEELFYWFCVGVALFLLIWFPVYTQTAIIVLAAHYAFRLGLELDAHVHAWRTEESNYSGSV